MKRIILSESEKKHILLKHNLLFEGTTEDQQIMMKFKNEFMTKSYNDIADGLEKMKSAPGLDPKEIEEIEKATKYLRGGNKFMADTAKQMVNKKFDEYINSSTDVAKNMLCYLITQNTEYSNSEIKSFCEGNSKPEEVKKDEITKKPEELKKVDEPKKVEVKKSTNVYAPGSIANPYGTDNDVYTPGSIANPYGS